MMNLTSSRSHSIFCIVVECSQSDDRGDHIRVGKLNLVDLAGSERQSKTGATGDRCACFAPVGQESVCRCRRTAERHVHFQTPASCRTNMEQQPTVSSLSINVTCFLASSPMVSFRWRLRSVSSGRPVRMGLVATGAQPRVRYSFDPCYLSTCLHETSIVGQKSNRKASISSV